MISDSAPEAFVVALRTYAALSPASAYGQHLERLSGPEGFTAERLRADPLYARFLAMMPFGNRAEDYGVELDALEEGREITDQESYDAFRATRSPEWLRTYHKHFYRVRASFSEEDPQGWRRLLAPYPPFIDLLRRRAGQVFYAIATSKDRRSAGTLLRDYGIADLFPEHLVLDKETGESKAAHLQFLRQALGVAYEETTFVDDKVTHLDHVGRLGVRCALAAWGYNGPREQALARQRGYLVCSLGDIDAQLFG